jgi:hypothetical protein
VTDHRNYVSVCELLKPVTTVSAKHLGVGRFVESNDQSLSFSKRRGSEFPVAAHDLEEFFPSGLLFLKIEKDNLFPDTGIDFVDLFHQIEDFCFGNGHFAGVHFDFDINIVLRKKLLRASTGLSSGPMITPIHSSHRGYS